MTVTVERRIDAGVDVRSGSKLGRVVLGHRSTPEFETSDMLEGIALIRRWFGQRPIQGERLYVSIDAVADGSLSLSLDREHDEVRLSVHDLNSFHDMDSRRVDVDVLAKAIAEADLLRSRP